MELGGALREALLHAVATGSRHGSEVWLAPCAERVSAMNAVPGDIAVRAAAMAYARAPAAGATVASSCQPQNEEMQQTKPGVTTHGPVFAADLRCWPDSNGVMA